MVGSVVLRIACLTIVLLLAAAFSAKPGIVGSARVVDGDSLEAAGVSIRLHGIDAPEGRQRCTRGGVDWLCGAEAAKALRELVRGRQVQCEEVTIDAYGRTVATCMLDDGQDIGERMVRDGWALAYRRFSTVYVSAEDEARADGRGLWQGEFVPPWVWRERRRK